MSTSENGDRLRVPTTAVAHVTEQRAYTDGTRETIDHGQVVVDDSVFADPRVLFESRMDPMGDQIEVFIAGDAPSDEGFGVGIETFGNHAVLIHDDERPAFAAAVLGVAPHRLVVLPDVEVVRGADGGAFVRREPGVDGSMETVSKPVANDDVSIETMRAFVEMSERTLATRRAVLALLEVEASRG